jgi:hypothetical protein
MKTSESEIERMLQDPQRFVPPAGLKERLIEEIPGLGQGKLPSPSLTGAPLGGGWFRRWWPALVPGAISFACAAVLTAQQGTIRELKSSNQALSQAAAEANTVQLNNGAPANASPDSSPGYQQEIDRLKQLAAQLRAEVTELQQLQGSENPKLRAQLATPTDLALTPDEAESMAKAKEKALSIACINNLKQFGLAVRVWALDNNDSNPPNVVCMSNELSTPKILVCPADTNRPVATDFFSFSMANCTYEFLAPSEVTDKEPQRVLSRCPIHGHIGLCDGSVQSSVAKNHPDWLVEQDGKVYMVTPDMIRQRQSQPSAPAPNPQEEQMKKFRERYGIWPSNQTAPNQNP